MKSLKGWPPLNVLVFILLLAVGGVLAQQPCEKQRASLSLVSATLYDAPQFGRQCKPYGYSYRADGSAEPLYYVHADGTKTVAYQCGPNEIQSGVKGVRGRKRRAHVQQGGTQTIKLPGDVQTNGEAAIPIPCVAETSVQNFNKRYMKALRIYSANASTPLSERECLISQWFFGAGMKEGASIITRTLRAHAPQKPEPKPEAKPVVLSPEASQQWMEAQRQINELQLKIDNLRLQQTVIALQEGAPKGYVVGGRDDQGRIFYVPAPAIFKTKPNP